MIKTFKQFILESVDNNELSVGDTVKYLKADGNYAQNKISEIKGDRLTIITKDGKKVFRKNNDVLLLNKTTDENYKVGDEVIFLRAGQLISDYNPYISEDKQKKVVTKTKITKIEGDTLFFDINGREIKKHKNYILKKV